MKSEGEAGDVPEVGGPVIDRERQLGAEVADEPAGSRVVDAPRFDPPAG